MFLELRFLQKIENKIRMDWIHNLSIISASYIRANRKFKHSGTDIFLDVGLKKPKASFETIGKGRKSSEF